MTHEEARDLMTDRRADRLSESDRAGFAERLEACADGRRTSRPGVRLRGDEPSWTAEVAPTSGKPRSPLLRCGDQPDRPRPAELQVRRSVGTG